MRPFIDARGAVLAFVILGCLGVPGGPPRAEAAGALELDVADVPVVTQDGDRVRFRSDLLAGKVVAINFVFTTCTTICPPLGATFRKVQDALGDRLGKEVALISVSVDPVNDTPERLKAWGRKFGAGPGWTLVTGTKPDMDRLLRSLTAYTSRPEEHTPMVLVGDDGHWTRVYGLAPAATLVAAVEDALAASRAHRSAAEPHSGEERR